VMASRPAGEVSDRRIPMCDFVPTRLRQAAARGGGA
jgi:hypothetical protein